MSTWRVNELIFTFEDTREVFTIEDNMVDVLAILMVKKTPWKSIYNVATELNVGHRAEEWKKEHYRVQFILKDRGWIQSHIFFPL
tara:strand:- start:26 stop:280 length:255 start_codon:yes stop_codon:yes gene_type:complete